MKKILGCVILAASLSAPAFAETPAQHERHSFDYVSTHNASLKGHESGCGEQPKHEKQKPQKQHKGHHHKGAAHTKKENDQPKQ